MSNKVAATTFWIVSALLLVGTFAVHWRWSVDGLGVVGSYASVVGLILTIYVAVSVRQVRERYVRRIHLDNNYRKLAEAIGQFDSDRKTERAIRNLAATILPLMDEVRLHLPKGMAVECPTEELKELSDCSDERLVKPKAKELRPKLKTFQTQVNIHREKEDWGRVDG